MSLAGMGGKPGTEQVQSSRAVSGSPALKAALQVLKGWPVAVFGTFPVNGWPELLDSISQLDGDDWRTWNDRGAAARFAELVRSELTGSAEESVSWPA